MALLLMFGTKPQGSHRGSPVSRFTARTQNKERANLQAMQGVSNALKQGFSGLFLLFDSKNGTCPVAACNSGTGSQKRTGTGATDNLS
jgi:hypothetical protein